MYIDVTSYYLWPLAYCSSLCFGGVWGGCVPILCERLCVCLWMHESNCSPSCWVWIGVVWFINGSVVFLHHQPFKAHYRDIDSVAKCSEKAGLEKCEFIDRSISRQRNKTWIVLTQFSQVRKGDYSVTTHILCYVTCRQLIATVWIISRQSSIIM